jgi:hypothetical protein
VGLNSPRDDHVSNTLEPLNKVADVDHLYKEPAVAPKGLAYATPELRPPPGPYEKGDKTRL